MTAKRITLSDGTKLTTASSCRFVTFSISDDSRVTIHRRTDNYQTADQNHHRVARGGYLRVVTVDFQSGTVRLDSANPRGIATGQL